MSAARTHETRAHETRALILDAAQTLFAGHGFEATSMRMITTTAGVNLAAVNYHFGSKDELVRAVILRRLQPLNAQRMQALDEVEAEAEGAPVKARTIVECFFGGSLTMAAESGQGREFMRLLGRTFTEPSAVVRDCLAAEYAPVIGALSRRLQPRAADRAGRGHRVAAAFHVRRHVARGVGAGRAAGGDRRAGRGAGCDEAHGAPADELPARRPDGRRCRRRSDMGSNRAVRRSAFVREQGRGQG